MIEGWQSAPNIKELDSIGAVVSKDVEGHNGRTAA